MKRGMSIREKIATWLLKGSGKVLNRYEDASYQFGERSWLPAAVQDARQDIDPSTRIELVRRSREWDRNFGILQHIKSAFCQYVVGPNGLHVAPNCAVTGGKFDPEIEQWDEIAAQWWSSWSKFPCVDFSLPLGPIQNLIAGSWFIDGEIFIYKTYSQDSKRPRIQLIEGHRIGTPPEKRSKEGRSIVDGIEFAPDQDGRPSGRPLRYWLRTDVGTASVFGGYVPDLGPGKYRPLDAKDVIHLFKPTRPGQCRGLPLITGRMNDVHDLADLQFLEQKAARDAAKITNVITNKTGERELSSSRRQRFQIQTQDAAGNPVAKQNPLFYEITVGGETWTQAIGEKVEQFKSERPTVAVREHWEYLTRKIAGPMWPAVLPQSVQGTQFRALLEVTNSFFRSHTAIISAVMREVYMFAMGWGVQFDRSLDGAPRQWYHTDIIPPKSIIVDLGRDSKSRLDALKAGTWTYRDECGERGHYWRTTLRQKAIEAAFINRLVDEYDVTGRQIAELAQESLRVTEKISETAAEREAEQPDTKEGGETVGPAPAPSAAVHPITVNIDNKRPVTTKTIEVVRQEGMPTKFVVQETEH